MIRRCRKGDLDPRRPRLVWCAYDGRKVVARGSSRRAARCHEKRLRPAGGKRAKRRKSRGA